MYNNTVYKNISNTKKGKAFLLFPFLLMLIINCFVVDTLKAQTGKDSVITKSVHSPKKAALMSAILPGLGQAYNKQYWKVPVLYAGIATLTYFYITNNKYYTKYKNEYVFRLNKDSAHFDPVYKPYEDIVIQQLKDYYERNYELTIIISCAVYALNIIDASVYGHLFSFDVSTDLSLKIEPVIFNSFNSINNSPSGGIKLSLRF